MRQLSLLLAGCFLGWAYARPLTGSFERFIEHVPSMMSHRYRRLFPSVEAPT